jgi:hypothetical protein
MMPIADVNGIQIAYDMRGPAGAPAILLIMGLGTQMIAWSDPFCDALAAGGYQVVRFDNRDVGLSSKIVGGRPVNMKWAFTKAMLRHKVRGPYTLDDMAADGLGLMDKLGQNRACRGRLNGRHDRPDHRREKSGSHAQLGIDYVVLSGPKAATGYARGTQSVVRNTPRRIRSREYHQTHDERLSGHRKPRVPGPRRCPAFARGSLRQCSYYPQGIGRQMLAAGKHTAQAVPGAKLEIVPGMGHDLPPGLVPTLRRIILDIVGRSTQSRDGFAVTRMLS